MRNNLSHERETSAMSRAQCLKTEENIKSVFFSIFPFAVCFGEKR